MFSISSVSITGDHIVSSKFKNTVLSFYSFPFNIGSFINVLFLCFLEYFLSVSSGYSSYSLIVSATVYPFVSTFGVIYLRFCYPLKSLHYFPLFSWLISTYGIPSDYVGNNVFPVVMFALTASDAACWESLSSYFTAAGPGVIF